MSVINFSDKEWQLFYNTLCQKQINSTCGKLKIIKDDQLREFKEIYKDESEEDIIKGLIEQVVKKLALMNQVCGSWTYALDRGKESTLNPLKLEDPTLEILNNNKLYDFVTSLRYNLVSNGGTRFETEELKEVLDHIERKVAYYLIEGFRRLKNE